MWGLRQVCKQPGVGSVVSLGGAALASGAGGLGCSGEGAGSGGAVRDRFIKH